MKHQRFSPAIQKLVDQAERAEKAKRAKPKPAKFAGSLPRFPARPPPRRKPAKHATALRVPSLPADHPFNRPRKAGKKRKARTGRKVRKTSAAKKPTRRTGRARARSRKSPRKLGRSGRKVSKARAVLPRRTRSGRKPKRTHRLAPARRSAASFAEREARMDLRDAEGGTTEAYRAAEWRYQKALAAEGASRRAPVRARHTKLGPRGFRRIR